MKIISVRNIDDFAESDVEHELVAVADFHQPAGGGLVTP